MTTNNDAEIDAWMEARGDDDKITNADLASLLALLPPDEVILLEDWQGNYANDELRRRFLAVGEKSFRLYIGFPRYPAHSREKEDANAN